MLQNVIIHPSKNPRASLLHVFPKQSGWVVVVNYRHVNDINTCKDAFSFPHLRDFSATLDGFSVFSTTKHIERWWFYDDAVCFF